MKKGKKRNRSPLKFRIFLDSFVFIKFTLEYLQNLRGPMQEKYKNALVTNNLYKSGKIKPMSRTCMCGVIKNFGIKKFDSNFNLIVKFLVNLNSNKKIYAKKKKILCSQQINRYNKIVLEFLKRPDFEPTFLFLMVCPLHLSVSGGGRF